MNIEIAAEFQIDEVRALFAEYAQSLEFDLGFQGFNDELASLSEVYAPPRGCILLATQDSQTAGCVALRPWDDSIAEMKRLYVRPAFQGIGFGRKLAMEICARAKIMGYRRVRLDTVPTMTAAIAMYRSMGFISIDPYRENPIPGTSYLEKELT